MGYHVVKITKIKRYSIYVDNVVSPEAAEEIARLSFENANNQNLYLESSDPLEEDIEYQMHSFKDKKEYQEVAHLEIFNKPEGLEGNQETEIIVESES